MMIHNNLMSSQILYNNTSRLKYIDEKKAKKIAVVCRVFFCLCIALLVFTVIGEIHAINAYNDALAQYEYENNAWFNSWWNGNGATLNDKPDYPINSNILPTIFLVLLFPATILLGIFSFYDKIAKSTNERIKEQKEIDEKKTDEETKELYCEYCGSKFTGDESKCLNCGGKRSKIKKS